MQIEARPSGQTAGRRFESQQPYQGVKIVEKLLSGVGSMLYGMRFTMMFFYIGLVAIIFGILGKFLLETYKLMSTLLFGDLEKIDLIIKVLELVDPTTSGTGSEVTMVAVIHFTFVLSAVGISFAERMTREHK